MRCAYLTSLLRCPECGGAFREEGERLICSAGHAVPVVRDVPRFVQDDGYAGNFGFEWSTFATTQVDRHREAGDWSRDLYGKGVVEARQESARTFELKTGLRAHDLRGRRVLDVGCGTGRFADVAASLGAEVIGIDLTRAIDVAAANLGQREDACFVQADLRRLPFVPGSFDVIYSIGVLHHTPDTRLSFESLLPLLRPGGTIAIWVYERAPWRRPWLPPAQAFSDAYRAVTTRLPHDVLLGLCRARARLDDTVRHPIARRILSKIVPASDHPDLEWRTLDTFDWYSPRYQWKHTEAEVREWFVAAGLTDVKALDVPVAVRGTRRA